MEHSWLLQRTVAYCIMDLLGDLTIEKIAVADDILHAHYVGAFNSHRAVFDDFENCHGAYLHIIIKALPVPLLEEAEGDALAGDAHSEALQGLTPLLPGRIPPEPTNKPMSTFAALNRDICQVKFQRTTTSIAQSVGDQACISIMTHALILSSVLGNICHNWIDNLFSTHLVI